MHYYPLGDRISQHALHKGVTGPEGFLVPGGGCLLRVGPGGGGGVCGVVSQHALMQTPL